jgi:hypothetical protein
MPLESVEQAIGFLKTMCEEYGDEFPLDEGNLYRHVRALLTDEEIPSALPADIVERGASSFAGLEVGSGKDREEAEALTRPVATPEQWRAAAEWAFLFYRDFLGEDPSTGDEDGYLTLIAGVQTLLHAKIFSRKLPPPS